jgi:hypothetical protein
MPASSFNRFGLIHAISNSWVPLYVIEINIERIKWRSQSDYFILLDISYEKGIIWIYQSQLSIQEGNMDHNRVLELAIEELQRQKAGIEAEIEMIREEIGKLGISAKHRTGKPPVVAAAKSGRTRPRTAAEKKAQSDKMRKYWAARRSAGKK